MSLRSLGRWLYHAITSSDKRPYIESSLEELEDLADESSSASEAFRMLGIFDELTYRITSPERRDRLKTRIANQLLQMEGIRLPISSDRDKVSEIRAQLLSRYAEKTDAERAAKEEAAAEKERLEAEARAQREKARLDAARKSKEEAAIEKARLEAEAKAQREAEDKARKEAEDRAQQEEAERREADCQAREAAAEKERLEAEARAQREKARLEAEAKAQREAEEKARREAERKAKEEASAKKTRLAAEAEAQRQAEEEEQARQAAEAERQRLEQERQTAEAEAQRQAEEEEQARQAAEAERQRLEQERQAAEAEAQRQAEEEEQARQAAEAERQRLEQERQAAEAEAQLQAEEEEQARQAAEAERQRLEQERLAAEAEAQRQAEEEQALLLSRECLDSGSSAQWAPDIKAQSEQLADQQSNDESPQNQQNSQVELEDWQKWKEGDWNRCLLRYCFLSLGESDTRTGVPSSVEDLRFAVGDPKANPSELADAFVKSIISQAERHNAKPGRLFTKRAENWNPDTPLEPPFFAFLWATCLISQGYPNPYETGQFHMRYLRVFGAEQRSTFKSLKLGWEKLSQWLEQEKALGGKDHRELTLPTELGNRTNIGYSWFLSFPSRNDRAELALVIQQLLDDGIALVPLTAQALFAIKRGGRFGAEFTRTLDKQIRLAAHTGVVDDWFAGIIEHEYNQLQSATDTTPSTARRSGRPENPDLSLQLDLEDPSRITLVLPRQELTGLEESNQSVTFCTLDPVGSEHPWDPKKGIVCIGEVVCQTVTEMVPAWTWKLRSGSSSGYTLKRWSCAGIEPGDHPILCFCAESGQRMSGKSILSASSEAWFFAPKNLQPSPTEFVEILDELRWGVSLKGWRGYLLRLTQPKAELLWQGADESGHQQTFSLPWTFLANVTPVLRGSLIDKKKRAYSSSPSLWIPPLSEPVELILTIKDLSTNQLVSDTSDLVELQASEAWTEIDLSECIESESRFSILVQPQQDHPELPGRWKTTFQVHKPFENQDDNELVTPLLTCLHNDRPISRQMDAGFRSFFYEDISDFWLARWLLERAWPMESLDLTISNGINSCQDTLIADHEGTLEISAAVYRYMLQGEANSISIAVQRQGEQSSYVLATAGDEAQSIPITTSTSTVAFPPSDPSPASPKTSPSRGRPVDFVINFQPRFTGKNGKKQVADFTKYMKQLIAEAGISSEELHPQNLDNDVWIRAMNQEHLSEIDKLLEEAGEMCGFKILKQRRR